MLGNYDLAIMYLREIMEFYVYKHFCMKKAKKDHLLSKGLIDPNLFRGKHKSRESRTRSEIQSSRVKVRKFLNCDLYAIV